MKTILTSSALIVCAAGIAVGYATLFAVDKLAQKLTDKLGRARS